MGHIQLRRQFIAKLHQHVYSSRKMIRQTIPGRCLYGFLKTYVHENVTLLQIWVDNNMDDQRNVHIAQLEEHYVCARNFVRCITFLGIAFEFLSHFLHKIGKLLKRCLRINIVQEMVGETLKGVNIIYRPIVSGIMQYKKCVE